MVVLGDADLDRAAEGAVRDCFGNAGQLCVSMERIYVVESVHDAFLDRFLGRVRAMRLGSDLGYGPDMGSLIAARQLERVTAHVEDAVAKGATVLAGGRARPDLGPYFYEPTVLSGVREDMALCRDETFGPVVAVTPVRDTDEAVARANDSDVRAQRLGLDPGRRPRPARRGAHPHRDGEHQRDVRRGVGRDPGADGWRQGLRARPPARARRHPQVHRAANRCGATVARLRAAAVGVVRHLGPRVHRVTAGPQGARPTDDARTPQRLRRRGRRLRLRRVGHGAAAGREGLPGAGARGRPTVRRRRVRRAPRGTCGASCGRRGWAASASSASTGCPTSRSSPGPASAVGRWSTPTRSTARTTRSTTTRSGATSPTGGPSSPRRTTWRAGCSASRRTRRSPRPTWRCATVADQMGVGHTFALTPVGVFFGDAAGAHGAGPVLRRRRPGPHRLPRSAASA